MRSWALFELGQKLFVSSNSKSGWDDIGLHPCRWAQTQWLQPHLLLVDYSHRGRDLWLSNELVSYIFEICSRWESWYSFRRLLNYASQRKWLTKRCRWKHWRPSSSETKCRLDFIAFLRWWQQCSCFLLTVPSWDTGEALQCTWRNFWAMDLDHCPCRYCLWASGEFKVFSDLTHNVNFVV